MDAGSRSSGGVGFDDDDGLAARRELSSSLKGSSILPDRSRTWLLGAVWNSRWRKDAIFMGFWC